MRVRERMFKLAIQRLKQSLLHARHLTDSEWFVIKPASRDSRSNCTTPSPPAADFSSMTEGRGA
jgi:hypothetical protein